jgi:hypothetical protein
MYRVPDDDIIEAFANFAAAQDWRTAEQYATLAFGRAGQARLSDPFHMVVEPTEGEH